MVQPTYTYVADENVAQGDDRPITLWFEDQTISSWEFFFTAKKRHSFTDDDAAIKIDTSEVLLSDSGAGFIDTVTFWLTSAKTTIALDNYNYDIKIIKESTVVNTLIKGVLTIESHQTRRKS